MTFAISVTVLGTLASVACLLVACVQSIRLTELRRRSNADIWKSITTSSVIRGEMEGAAAFKQNDHQLHQIYGRLVEQFRDLLKMAVLDERRFTEETITRWRNSGRLTNDWEEAQARRYLATEDIRRVEPTHPKTPAS